MGAERLDHVPDVLERGVVERVLGVGVLIDKDGDHDRPDLLVGRFANRPPERLDNVDLRVFRVDERNSVERRHIDPLTQATGIGKEAALALANRPQVMQASIALRAAHLPRDMLGPKFP